LLVSLSLWKRKKNNNKKWNVACIAAFIEVIREELWIKDLECKKILPLVADVTTFSRRQM
jgi:hypothetical protein